MTAYISDYRYSTREHLRLRKTFNKMAGYRINSINSISLLYTNDRRSEEGIGDISPFIRTQIMLHKSG